MNNTVYNSMWLDNLSKGIKEHRKDMKLSQKALAGKLNVSQQTVSGWESGKSIPDMPMLITLCNFFGCEVDSILGRIDDYETHDNKWICEKTGLSEQTIKNLKRDPSMVYTINYVQTCSCASSLFKDIRSYIEASPIPLTRGEEVQEVNIGFQDGKYEHFAFDIKDVYYGGEKITHETIRTTILYRIRDNLETIRKKKEYSLRMNVK